jgi:ribosomal protein L21
LRGRIASTLLTRSPAVPYLAINAINGMRSYVTHVVGAPKYSQRAVDRMLKTSESGISAGPFDAVIVKHDAKDRPSPLSYPTLGVEVSVPTVEQEKYPQIKNPVFAVVDVKSKQFKVIQDDVLMVDLLKSVDINERVIFDRVMLLGSREQTTIGRPLVKGAAVLATVEEHTSTEKVLIFKKRRRTASSKRLRGFRAQVTILRINEVFDGQGPEPRWLIESGNAHNAQSLQLEEAAKEAEDSDASETTIAVEAKN